MRHEAHIGKLFGRITVMCMGSPRSDGAKVFRCSCSCGAAFDSKATHVVSGRTTSCGCRRREIAQTKTRTHGKTKTAEYEIWCSMKARCFRKTSTSYKNYGGRGITVCDRWIESFEAFLADMGPRPAGYSLERDDVDGHYQPENCRWIPLAEQARNTRRTKLDLELAEAVRGLTELGLPMTAVGRALKVHYSSVKQITYRKQWIGTDARETA